MDCALVHRLSTSEGRALLASLPPYDEERVLAVQADLRAAGHDPELVAAALTQARLRRRAVPKLGAAAGAMLLTQDGLEQATRPQLAQRHADRFVRAGVEEVWDLGCGIGADAMALAAAGCRVRAVEADEVTAAVAAANLRPWPEAVVTPGRIEDAGLPAGTAALGVGAWLDPARRLPGPRDVSGRARRAFRLDQLSPSWEAVQQVAARLPAVGAKLSPGFPRDRVPQECAAEWVSFRGEVLECVLWWGDLVEAPGRRAVVHTAQGWVTVAGPDSPAPLAAAGPEPGSWLYEPDGAVVQAGLVGALAAAVDGAELDPGIGYVSGWRAVNLPWARRWQVVEVLPTATRALRAWARSQRLGRVTVKKRGVATDPDRLRRELRLTGTQEAVLLLTRAAGRSTALHVRPAGEDLSTPS